MSEYKCRICESNDLEMFLDLGEQPWCNDFLTEDKIGTEKHYPLEILFCYKCTTVQIGHTIPKEIMYSNHLYLSGVSRTMCEHFKSVADKVCNKYVAEPGLVVDIGSNDGALLEAYKPHKMDLLGVEPCSIAASLAVQKGIPVDEEFFNYDYVECLLGRSPKAKVISAANVFYHVEELHSIVRGIKLLLDDNGVFVMQGSYLPSTIQTKAFDIMYHEHLLYYRVETLDYLLNQYGLEVFDLDEKSVHGGSIIAYISHVGARKKSEIVLRYKKKERNEGFHRFELYKRFGLSIADLRDQIVDQITSLSRNCSIYAFGAPAKGTVLLNYCNFTVDDIHLAVEKNTLKVGKYIPGTGIPIRDENKVSEPDYYLLLAWNFAEEFCSSKEFVEGRRKFIQPVPYPRILSK